MTSHYFRYILWQSDEIHYRNLCAAYSNFVQNADNPQATCVKVFWPLSNQVLSELELIREVSQQLQEKKNADVKKRTKKLDEGESEED